MFRDNTCGGKDHARQGNSRRDFLYVGAIGALGLTLGDYLKIQSAMGGEVVMPGTTVGLKEGKAKSVIHIYLPGGMASHESFDPKPDAPIEYRGPLGSVKTKIDGEYFSENMPETASIADKICVIRSLTHGEAAHERGTHNMFTGYRPNPAIQFPSFGSIVSEEFGPRRNMPPYVCIPSMPNVFAGSGYLSTKYGPFSLGADPANPGFRVQDLMSDVEASRFERRQSILSTVDNHFRQLEKSDALTAMDSFYQRAYSMISSKEAREAFDLSSEPDALKDKYGRNAAGQRMLLSRRLVEGGVRFISMTYGGWDHHANIKNAMKGQMPQFDQAFAALVRDLEDRKMLDSTLIMVSSEFGRTPKINASAGRDHWPKCFSVVLAGGGIKPGIFGRSDPTGGEPADSPVGVEMLAATVYHQMGIDFDRRIMAAGSRPIDIVHGGKVIEEIV